MNKGNEGVCYKKTMLAILQRSFIYYKHILYYYYYINKRKYLI